MRGEACCILHPAYPGCPFFTHTKLSKHFLFSAIKNCSHAPPHPASSPPPPPPSPPCCCCCSCCGSNVGRNFCCVALLPSPSLSLSLLERASHNRQLHTQPVAAPRSIDPSTEGAGEGQGGGGDGCSEPALQGGCGSGYASFFRHFAFNFFALLHLVFCFAFHAIFPVVVLPVPRYRWYPLSPPYPSTYPSALSDCLTLSTPLQSMHHHMI